MYKSVATDENAVDANNQIDKSIKPKPQATSAMSFRLRKIEMMNQKLPCIHTNSAPVNNKPTN